LGWPPKPSATVIAVWPRALRQRITPRTNSGSVVRPATPLSPPLVFGFLNQSKPLMLGLSKIGVAAGRFGTTASHSRWPSSRAVPPCRIVTGARSAATRARLALRSAAPSTVSPTTTGGPACQAGDAPVVVSTGGRAATAASTLTPGAAASGGAVASAASVAAGGAVGLGASPLPQAAAASVATARQIHGRIRRASTARRREASPARSLSADRR
jgi:hypothetical protein